jgi:medium-chain acyl-[acyl-carrier-protein] hydrolase
MSGQRPILVCLHAAGATSAMFAEFAEHLRDRLAVTAPDLPGRGSSYDRPPFRRVDEAVAHLLPSLRGLPDRGYGLFGYSMGALIGFELARALHETGDALPAALFVAAARAPQIPPREPPVHRLGDDDVLRELVRFQGTTPELLADRELMALVLPRLRADFELCETYVYRPGPRLPLPVHAFGGRTDEKISAADLAAWSEVAEPASTSEQWAGGHFFIQQSGEMMAERIAMSLDEAVGIPLATGIARHG